MNIHTNNSRVTCIIDRNRLKIRSKYLWWELRKIFTCLFFLASLLLPTNSLWFVLAVSSLLGSGYYILRETHPQMMMILSILLRYQARKLNLQIKKWFNFNIHLFNGTKYSRLQLEDNFNSLVYYDVKVGKKDKQYIYLFNEKLRSNDLIIFKDESDRDITDHIEPYLGPLQNFHGVPVTPGDFNCKKIKVFRDGDICLSKIFEEHEPIKFY